jgi:hypothetical protein
MIKKDRSIDLEKYPHLKNYLDSTNKSFDLDSDEDLFILFNRILKEINKKRDMKIDGDFNK